MIDSPKHLSFFYPAFKQVGTLPETGLGAHPCGTMALSVTGEACALRCAHCGGMILKNMQPASTPEELKKIAQRLATRGGRSLLISGGADTQGRVPLSNFSKTIKQIRDELDIKILVHTGLVSPEQADALAEANVDLAMLDIIGDEQTIREVYHLKAGIEDYEKSLLYLLNRNIPTAPHVVMGLHFGRIRGEAEALKIISRYPVRTLVLVGFRPIQGTAMAKAIPPSPEEMGELFIMARSLFPNTPVVLGCERPLGRHRRKTECLAIEAGLDGITYPCDQALALAEEKGIRTEFHTGCCALIDPVQESFMSTGCSKRSCRPPLEALVKVDESTNCKAADFPRSETYINTSNDEE
ncbi:MAG TPA: radical SAM protein [Thermodesulfobacteriota bacterium]|nr:radical SAM protein [Thermodesulfobacteriota bacterium]